MKGGLFGACGVFRRTILPADTGVPSIHVRIDVSRRSECDLTRYGLAFVREIGDWKMHLTPSVVPETTVEICISHFLHRRGGLKQWSSVIDTVIGAVVVTELISRCIPTPHDLLEATRPCQIQILAILDQTNTRPNTKQLPHPIHAIRHMRAEYSPRFSPVCRHPS